MLLNDQISTVLLKTHDDLLTAELFRYDSWFTKTLLDNGLLCTKVDIKDKLQKYEAFGTAFIYGINDLPMVRSEKYLYIQPSIQDDFCVIIETQTQVVTTNSAIHSISRLMINLRLGKNSTEQKIQLAKIFSLSKFDKKTLTELIQNLIDFKETSFYHNPLETHRLCNENDKCEYISTILKMFYSDTKVDTIMSLNTGNLKRADALIEYLDPTIPSVKRVPILPELN